MTKFQIQVYIFANQKDSKSYQDYTKFLSCLQMSMSLHQLITQLHENLAKMNLGKMCLHYKELIHVSERKAYYTKLKL